MRIPKTKTPRAGSGTLVKQAGGLIASLATRCWMSTLDFQGAEYEGGVDPMQPGFRGPAIFLLWHEYILFPFYLRGNCNIAMLLSMHQDAEWLSQAARPMGFETIRGSTTRGGVAALRESFRKTRTMNLAITPDGPRGPRRRLAQGCVYLSSKLQIPLLALGFGYDRPWRVRSAWDHFAVPRPYSRARTVASPFIQIPAGLDRSGLEHYRQRVESLLNRMTLEAEQWAESGTRRIGQRPLRRLRAAAGNSCGATSVDGVRRRGPQTAARRSSLPSWFAHSVRAAATSLDERAA